MISNLLNPFRWLPALKSRLARRGIDPDAAVPLLRRLFRDSFEGHFGRYALALFCMAMVAGSTVAMAYLMRHVINDIFVSQSLSRMWLLAGIILAISVIKGAADYAQTVLLATIGNDIVASLQMRVFRKLMALGLDFYAGTHSSKLVSRMSNHARAARSAVMSISTSLGKDLLTVIGLGGVMLAQDPLMGLLAIAFGPPVVFLISRIVRQVRKISEAEFQGLAAVIAATQEAVTGIRVVKSFTMEDAMQSRFDEAVRSVEARSNAMERIKAQTSPLMEAMGGIIIAVLIVYAGQQTITAGKTPGEFMAFITAFLLAYEPAKRLSRLHVSMQRDLVGIRKLYDVLDHDEQEPFVDPGAGIGDTRGEIRLEAVGFAYKKGQPVLRDVSIQAAPGELVALIGPSGAGKSTIVSLIQRLYLPSSGTVSMDGIDIAELNLRDLRRRISVVSQETILFSGSIAENIALGRPEASRAEIEAAAEAAFASGFIRDLPAGFDTEVGERGTSLSGGQAQRIAIARAVLKDAPVLLLDEATSALDTETEREVREALATLMQGRTTIVIAHRLSTIMMADRIYVLRDGEVVAIGTHESLLAGDALYRRLFGSGDTDEAGEGTVLDNWEILP